MRLDPRSTPGAIPHDRDVDECRRGAAHRPRVPGAVVAEHRAVTAREHRRPQPAEGTDGPMADGIHARVEPEQPPRREPRIDLTRGHPACEQLPARDDAALALGEQRDDPVRGVSSTHVVEEAPRGADSPP